MTDTGTSGHEAGHGPAEVHYEKRDLRPAAVIKAVLVVVGLGALTALALIGYVGVLMREDARRTAEPRGLGFETGRQPALPRLQEAPFGDIRALRAAEEQELNGYGWVDRQAGVVRVPVDVAIPLFVERAPAGWFGVGPTPAPAAATAAGAAR